MEDPRILALADERLAAGTRVINTPASTRVVEDRLATDDLLESAGLPVPPRFTSPEEGQEIPPPYFRKPRSNYQHYISQVASFEDVTYDPSYYYQQTMPNDGAVRKLYIISQDVFLVTRDGPHYADFERKHLEHRVLHDTPPEWQSWALQVGELTGLEVYGVDVVGKGDEYYVIDVNPFPGYVGVPQAATCLFALILPPA
jgi:ribosomal protein S6--L-glutamate ligase